MIKTKLIIFSLCLLFTTSFGDGTKADSNNTSAELTDSISNEFSTTNGTSGPPDSHEAMNTHTREATASRKKRNAETDKKAFRNMLLGIVHKKSNEIKDHEDEQEKFQSDASELLLELMVRIAAHPQQWDEVHDLLQKIDSDILTSKKILTDIQNTATTTATPPTDPPPQTTTIDEVQKLIILLDDNSNSTRVWPNLDEEKDKTTPKKNSTREFEFSYHRVTGLPLPYRSNYDKTRARNAYIAVSVIAPKVRDLQKQDNLLEDELRQLKPWSHEENLNKMENIRKKWFIRQDVQDVEKP